MLAESQVNFDFSDLYVVLHNGDRISGLVNCLYLCFYTFFSLFDFPFLLIQVHFSRSTFFLDWPVGEGN